MIHKLHQFINDPSFDFFILGAIVGIGIVMITTCGDGSDCPPCYHEQPAPTPIIEPCYPECWMGING